MKKILIGAVLILGVVLLIALNSFKAVGEFYDDGYVLADNKIQENLTSNESTEVVPGIEVHVYDTIYSRGRTLFVGDETKKKFTKDYPLYINDGSAVKLLSGEEKLIDSNFSSLETYEGVILSDGVLHNDDGTRSDWNEYYFVRLNNGLFVNSLEVGIDTLANKYTIPVNSMINFESDRISYYEYKLGAFQYKSAEDVHDDTKITIGDTTMLYKDLRNRLGLFEEEEKNSLWDDLMDKLFRAETEDVEEETEPETKKKKPRKTTGSDNEAAPAPFAPTDIPEHAGTVEAVSSVEDAEDADKASKGTTPETPPEPPPPHKPDPGWIENPDWVMPVVKAGKNFKAGVYTLETSAKVDDPAGVIIGGLTYEVTIYDETGKGTLYRRLAFNSYEQKQLTTVLIPGLKPDSNYSVTGSFQYKDKYGRTVTESVIFLKKYKFKTGPVTDLGDIVMLDMNLSAAEIKGDSIQIPRIQFDKEKSDNDAVGSLTKIIARFTTKESYGSIDPDVVPVVMSASGLETVMSYRATVLDSGRTLKPGTEYMIDIVCCDRYNNQLKVKGSHGESRTCKLLPTAELTIDFDENDLSEHISVKVKKQSDLEYTDCRIRIRDSLGNIIKINGDEYVPISEDGELIITSLGTNKSYTAEFYITCDNGDRKGNVRRFITSKSFVTASLSKLGQLYVIAENTTEPDKSYNTAKLTLKINEELTKPSLIPFIDIFDVTFLAGNERITCSLDENQIARLKNGEEVEVNTDDYVVGGLKSFTKYTIAYEAYKVFDADSKDMAQIKVNSTLTSLRTSLTPVRVEIINGKFYAGYMAMDIKIKDVDDVIKGDSALLKVYSVDGDEKKLEAVYSIEKNAFDYYELRMTKEDCDIPADQEFSFEFIAEQAVLEKGTVDNYPLCDPIKVTTNKALTGKIYSGGLTDNGDGTFNAKIYMDIYDPTNEEGVEKSVYVRETRTNIPEYASISEFTYTGHTFDTRGGWLSKENARFYSEEELDEDKIINALPDGYTQLEYIESNGNSYINTAIKAEGEGYVLQVKYQTTKAGEQYIAGAIDSKTSLVIKTLSTGAPDTSAALVSNKAINGITTAKAVSKDACDSAIYLFTAFENPRIRKRASMKMYSASITSDKGEILAYYIPCREESTGKIGLYNVFSALDDGTVKYTGFYECTQGESFIAGPDVLTVADTWSPSNVLKPGYREVEYIDNTAAASPVIDLKVIPGSNWSTEAVVSFHDSANSNAVYGAGGTAYNSPNAFECYQWKSGSNNIQFDYGGNAGYIAPWLPEHKVMLRQSKAMSSVRYENTNKTYTINAGQKNFTSNYSLCLYSTHRSAAIPVSGTGKFRLYSFKVWDGEKIMLNLVPCVKEEGNVAGMYDLLTGEFYGPTDSSKSFTYAGQPGIPTPDPDLPEYDLPDQYRQVEFIESHGAEYIDTGFIQTASMEVDAHLNNPVMGANYLFGGTRNSGGYMFNGLGNYTTDSVYHPYMEYNFARKSIAVDKDIDMVQDISGKTMTIKYRTGAGEKTYTYTTGTPDETSMLIFASYNASEALQIYSEAVRLYKFVIRDTDEDGNEDIRRNFVPVYDSITREYGLYDTVTNLFYGNLGSGAFTGPDWPKIDTLIRGDERMSFIAEVEYDQVPTNMYQYELYSIVEDTTGETFELPISWTEFSTEEEIYTISSGEEFIDQSPNERKYVVINDIGLDNTDSLAAMVDTCNAYIDFQGFSFDISVNTYPIVNTISAEAVIRNMVLKSYAPLRRKQYSTVQADKNDGYTNYRSGQFCGTNRGTLTNLKIEMSQENVPYVYKDGLYWSDLSPDEIAALEAEAAQESDVRKKEEDSATMTLARSKFFSRAKAASVSGDNYGTIENFVLETKTPVYASVYSTGITLTNQAGGVIRNGYIYGSYTSDNSAEFYHYEQTAFSSTGYNSNAGCGAVAGYTTGKGALIENIYVIADMKSYVGSYNRLGGITGRNAGSGAIVRNCYVVGDSINMVTGKPNSSSYGPAVGEKADGGTVETTYYFSDFTYDNAFNSITTLAALRSDTWQNGVLNSNEDNQRFAVEEAVATGCFPQLIYTIDCMPPQPFIPLPISGGSSIIASDWDIVYSYTYVPGKTKVPPYIDRALLDENVTGKWAWYEGDTIKSDTQVLGVLVSDTQAREVYEIQIENFPGVTHDDILGQYKNGLGITEVFVRLHEPTKCITNYKITGLAFETVSGKSGGIQPIANVRYAYAEYFRRIDNANTDKNSWVDFRSNQKTNCAENMVLGADIDFSGLKLNQISWWNVKFGGKFDGNNKTIKNIDYDDNTGKTLSISTSVGASSPGIGLMGEVTGKIYNLTMENFAFEGGGNAGGLAYYLNGASVDNVYLKNGYVGGGNLTGGFAGYSYLSTINNCGVTDVKVLRTQTSSTSASFIGGAIGRIDNFTDISRSFVQNAYIESMNGVGAGGFAGAVAASSANVTIKGCYATGDLITGDDFAGGFIGAIESGISIVSCYSDVDIYTFGSLSGGFAGVSKSGTYSGLMSFGNVSAASIYTQGTHTGDILIAGAADERYDSRSLQALRGRVDANSLTGAVFADAVINMSKTTDASDYNTNFNTDANYRGGALTIDNSEYMSTGPFSYLLVDYFENNGYKEGKLPKIVDEDRNELPNQSSEYLVTSNNDSPLDVVSVSTSGSTITAVVKHKPGITIKTAYTDFTYVDSLCGLMDGNMHKGLPSFTSHQALSGRVRVSSPVSEGRYSKTTITISDISLQSYYDTYWLTGIGYSENGTDHVARVSQRLQIEQKWRPISSKSAWDNANVAGSHCENFKISGDIDFSGALHPWNGDCNMVVNRLVGMKGSKANYKNEDEFYKLSNINIDESESGGIKRKTHGWANNYESGFIKAVMSEIGNLEFNNVRINRPQADYSGIIGYSNNRTYGLRFVDCELNHRQVAAAIPVLRGRVDTIYLENVNSRSDTSYSIGDLSYYYPSLTYNCSMEYIYAKDVSTYQVVSGYSYPGILTGDNRYYMYTNGSGAYQYYTSNKRYPIKNIEVDHAECTSDQTSVAGIVTGIASYNTYGDVVITDSLMSYGAHYGENGTGAVFGYNKGYSSASNCKVLNSKIIAPGKENVGGIVGYNPSSVTNCEVTDCEITAKKSVGAIVGLGASSASNPIYGCKVKDCLITGTDANVGGAVGSGYNIYNMTIENCVVTNTSTGSYTGGVAGIDNSGNVTTSNNRVTNTRVTSEGSYVGGCFGKASNTSSCLHDNYVYNCEIRGKSYVGGIAGEGSVLKVNNRISNVTVVGTGDYVGGAEGRVTANGTGTVDNTYSEKDDGTGGVSVWIKDCFIYGSRYVGGAAGGSSKVNEWSAIVENADIRGYQYVGGAMGGTKSTDGNRMSRSYVKNTYIAELDEETRSKYNITKQSSFQYFGGVFGCARYANSDEAINCIIDARDANYVGGIGGRIETGSGTNDITNGGLISKDCVVIGNQYVSGMFGDICGGFYSDYVQLTDSNAEKRRGIICNSYSNALVYGKDRVAGIAGRFTADKGTVKIVTEDATYQYENQFGLTPIVRDLYFTGILHAVNADTGKAPKAYGVFASTDIGQLTYSDAPTHWLMKLEGVTSVPGLIDADSVYPVMGASDLEIANKETNPQFITIWGETLIKTGSQYKRMRDAVPDYTGTLDEVYAMYKDASRETDEPFIAMADKTAPPAETEFEVVQKFKSKILRNSANFIYSEPHMLSPLARYDKSKKLFEFYYKDSLYLEQGVSLPGSEAYEEEMSNLDAMYDELQRGMIPVGPAGFIDDQTIAEFIGTGRAISYSFSTTEIDRLDIDIKKALFTTNIATSSETEEYIQSISYTLVPTPNAVSSIISEGQKTKKTLTLGDFPSIIAAPDENVITKPYRYNYVDDLTLTFDFVTTNGATGTWTAKIPASALRRSLVEDGNLLYRIRPDNSDLEVITGGVAKTLYGPVANILQTPTGAPIALTVYGEKIPVSDFGDGIPSQYTRVEYIQSHGTEYIDTTEYRTVTEYGSDNPNLSKDDFYIKVKQDTNKNGMPFGSCYTNKNSIWLYYYDSPKAINLYYYNKSGTQRSTSVLSPWDTNAHEINYRSGTVYCDGTKKSTLTISDVENSRYGLYLFSSRNNDGTPGWKFTGKIYRFKWWKNKAVQYDMIPVYDTVSRKYGLYDMVSGQFFGNKGTGAFSGPEF